MRLRRVWGNVCACVLWLGHAFSTHKQAHRHRHRHTNTHTHAQTHTAHAHTHTAHAHTHTHTHRSVDERSLRLQQLLQEANPQSGHEISAESRPMTSLGVQSELRSHQDLAGAFPPADAAYLSSASATVGWVDQGGGYALGAKMGRHTASQGASVSQGDGAGGMVGVGGAESQHKTPKAVTAMLDGIRDTLTGLDYLFIKASQDEHDAATKITRVAKGYLVRKKFAAGMAALRAFSTRQSAGMVVFFREYFERRREIYAQIGVMDRVRSRETARKLFQGLAEHVWSKLPTRINQRQRAYFLTVCVCVSVCLSVCLCARVGANVHACP